MSADDHRKPKRRWWWTKHVFAPLAILGGAAGGYWLWCDQQAGRELAEVVAALRAAGEPVAWPDHAPEPIADDANAAELYKKAAAVLWARPEGMSDEAFAALDLPLVKDVIRHAHAGRDVRRRYADELVAGLSVTAEARRLSRRARGRSRSDWKLDFSAPALTTALPALSAYGQLAQAHCTRAAAAHDAGDDAEAASSLRDALALGQSLGTQPALVPLLMRINIDALACGTLEDIAPTLRAGKGDDAARRQVRALLAELLDESDLNAARIRAYTTERSACYDTGLRVRAGELSLGGLQIGGSGGARDWLQRTVLRPALTRDITRCLHRMSGYVAAARTDCLPDARRHIPAPPPSASRLDRLLQPLSTLLVPARRRVFEIDYRNVATRRMAAIALAIRLHELDHGRRPAALADLAPGYLPAVPADPMAAHPGDAPAPRISYLPAAETPLLYSVGIDGDDDGGEHTDDFGQLDPDAADLPFFLNGDRPGEGIIDYFDAQYPRVAPALRPGVPTSGPVGPRAPIDAPPAPPGPPPPP